MSCSLDARYIALFLAPAVVVAALASPSEVHKIKGTEFNWSSNKAIVYSPGDDLFIYGVLARTQRLLVTKASKPRLLIGKLNKWENRTTDD